MPHETDLLPPGERFSFYLAPAGISASSHRYPKVMPRVAFHFLSRFPIKTNCSKPAYFSVFAKIYEGRLRLWSVGAQREREGNNGCKNGTGITRHLLLVILYVGSLFLHGLALSPLCSIIYRLSQNRSLVLQMMGNPPDARRGGVMKARVCKALRLSSFVRT